jgi:hypothetical protein
VVLCVGLPTSPCFHSMEVSSNCWNKIKKLIFR